MKKSNTTKKFTLNSAVILRSEPQYYNTYAAFNVRSVKTEFLEEQEYLALEYLYGKSEEINEVCRESGMENRNCKKFLEKMLKSGYIQDHEDNDTAKPPERVKVDLKRFEKSPIPFLSAPSSVDIFITSRCNLNCVHCFSSIEDNAIHELSTKELESIFDQLESLGVFEVRINGGEPFLHPEIDKILTDLKRRRFRKVILTNGILLDEKKVKLLKDSHVTPTISLDDSIAEEHDLFRGVKGSFSRTIEALKLLQKHKIQYGINCCLHKRNLNRFREIIKLVNRYGAYRIAFLDLKISNRLKKHIESIPSHNEYEEILFELLTSRIKNKGKIDVSLGVFLLCQPPEESIQEAKRGYVSCHAGRSRLTIDSKGSVYPCNMVLSDPKWRMGNIRDERISEIWFSEKWSFFRGEVKTGDLDKCRDCKDRKRCKDFYCRLNPYITNGNPLGPHPKCV